MVQRERLCVCVFKVEGEIGVRGREGVSERIFDDLLASRHQARNLD
jgi:hypothetical protein